MWAGKLRAAATWFHRLNRSELPREGGLGLHRSEVAQMWRDMGG